MKITLNKPDTIGAIASALCIIHCISTPFIFIVKSCTETCCAESPTWWSAMDYLFLVISFLAINKATTHSTNTLVKNALWISWLILFISILNEKFEFLPLSSIFIYIAGIAVSTLHIYNLKFCQCKQDKCCSINS